MPHRFWTFLITLTLLGAGGLSAQEKPPLDHEAYDIWNRIQGERLNADGSWVAYRVVPGDGDATLLARTLPSAAAAMSRERGHDHQFSSDGRWLVYRIAPHRAAVEQAERDDTPREEMPRDSLGAVLLDGSTPTEVFAVANVTDFRMPEEATGWLAYMLHESENPEPPEEEAEEEEPAEPEEEPVGESEEDEPERDRDTGAPLILRSLDTGEAHRFEWVTDYGFSDDGERLFYTAANEDGTADGVYRVDVASGAVTPIMTGEGRYTQMALDEEGERVAFLSNRDAWDSEADEPDLTLYLDGEAVVTASSAGVPSDWRIADDDIEFSENGERLIFGTQPRPVEDMYGDDVLDDEKVTVDVWNWRDPYIMPMQLVQRESELGRGYTALLDIDDGRVLQLGNPQIPDIEIGDEGNSRWALGTTDVPYRQMLSWDGRYSDGFLIDTETGNANRITEAVRGFGRARLSPTAKYAYWWEPFEKAWYIADTETGEVHNASEAIPVDVHDLFADRPEPPGPAGFMQWTADDERAIVYDWHDIWLVDPEGEEAPRNVTEGVGRAEELRFRIVDLDPEEDGVPMDEDIVLSAFGLYSKQDGFYRDRLDDSRPPELLVMDHVNFGFPRKAEESDVVLITKETFREFEDLHVTDTNFGVMQKISDANPQQEEYRWGTAELVSWTSSDGIPLQGILYKPEGFDPSEQYPMMVYFYERNSDGLHNHYVPDAGSSSINRSFYVSRGYVLFVPDIPYEVGHPGESALDAVVPGVLKIIEAGYVDSERVGVQGHSWGGYQIAHMITRTNLFAAAEAGAPVVNMTSAYGGIRWGSGMVRQFQYEQTQSRIGGSLWEKPLEYLDNSPLFQADKIETPLLMMHNDDDGAVPWYQGIEMFAAMRRLEKPVWMLNYNGEPHGLRREANQRDWAIRMQQFFDHYLMDAPAAVWMVEGVPATMKGKTLGLELVGEGKPITEDGQGGG